MLGKGAAGKTPGCCQRLLSRAVVPSGHRSAAPENQRRCESRGAFPIWPRIHPLNLRHQRIRTPAGRARWFSCSPPPVNRSDAFSVIAAPPQTAAYSCHVRSANGITERRAAPGIEPRTSRTQTENHTTRPSSLETLIQVTQLSVMLCLMVINTVPPPVPRADVAMCLAHSAAAIDVTRARCPASAS